MPSGINQYNFRLFSEIFTYNTNAIEGSKLNQKDVKNLLEKDKSGNARIGDIISADTKNSLIIGDKRLIVTIGLDDCIVVDTADAVLITKRGHSQKVKDIIGKLEKDNRREVYERK